MNRLIFPSLRTKFYSKIVSTNTLKHDAPLLTVQIIDFKDNNKINLKKLECSLKSDPEIAMERKTIILTIMYILRSTNFLNVKAEMIQFNNLDKPIFRLLIGKESKSKSLVLDINKKVF